MNLIETLEKLAELRAKATAGPWESPGIYTGSVFPMPSVSSSWVLGDGKPCDAAFVALAGSTDFPALLREAREMQARNAELEAEVKELTAKCDRLAGVVAKMTIPRSLEEWKHADGDVLLWIGGNPEYVGGASTILNIEDQTAATHFTTLPPAALAAAKGGGEA